MKAKDILTRKFEKSFNGYKMDDVDEFLKEVSEELNSVQRENKDLEKKLEVLADKIREYRNDEDALKEALLGAQKQGQKAISEAKEKAKKIITDAEEEVDKIKNALKEKNKLLEEESVKVKTDALTEAEQIISSAREEADKKIGEMNYQIEISKETLSRLKRETNNYSNQLINKCKDLISKIEVIPSECENDYVNKTITAHEKEIKEKSEKKPLLPPNKPIKIEKVKTSEDIDIARIYKEINEEDTVVLGDIIPNFEDSEKSKETEKDINKEMKNLSFIPVTKESAPEKIQLEDSKIEVKKSNINNNIFFKRSNNIPVNVNGKEVLEFGANKSVKKK